jgi:hypothetical protein
MFRQGIFQWWDSCHFYGRQEIQGSLQDRSGYRRGIDAAGRRFLLGFSWQHIVAIGIQQVNPRLYFRTTDDRTIQGACYHRRRKGDKFHQLLGFFYWISFLNQHGQSKGNDQETPHCHQIGLQQGSVTHGTAHIEILQNV